MNRLLMHWYTQTKTSGFTLIELLVSIIIIGVLASIAIPSYLSFANEARESEGLTVVKSINEAQKRYRVENGSFATTLSELELGIQQVTDNYRYEISGGGSSTIVNAVPLRNQGWIAGRTFVAGEQLFAVTCRGEAGTAIADISNVTQQSECPAAP